MEYNYVRQDKFVEPKEFPLIRIFESFGQLKDISQEENWKKNRLYKLYDRVQPFLSALMARAKKTKDLELNDYTPEAKEKRRKEFLSEPYRAILNIIQNERQTVQANVKNMEIRILNVTNPDKPQELVDRIDFNDRMNEIRQLIRAKEDIPDRIALVQKHLDGGDPSFLHALILGPDEIIPAKRLNEMRRTYAFKNIPTMRDAEHDAIQLSEAVKERTSQLGATAVAILQEHSLENPLSREEMFSYYPTDDRGEQARQDAFINRENDLLKRQQASRDFDEQQAA